MGTSRVRVVLRASRCAFAAVLLSGCAVAGAGDGLTEGLSATGDAGAQGSGNSNGSGGSTPASASGDPAASVGDDASGGPDADPAAPAAPATGLGALTLPALPTTDASVAGDGSMCANLGCIDVFDCAIFHAAQFGPCGFTACVNLICQ